MASAVSGIVLLLMADGAAAVAAGAGIVNSDADVPEDGDASSGEEATVGALASTAVVEAVVVVELLLGGDGGEAVVLVVVVVVVGAAVVDVVVVVVVVVVDVLDARNCEPDGRVGRPPRRLVVREVTEEVSSGAAVVVVRLVVGLGVRGGRACLLAVVRLTGVSRVGRVRRVANEDVEELSLDSVVVVVLLVVLGVPASSVALALASLGENANFLRANRG